MHIDDFTAAVTRAGTAEIQARIAELEGELSDALKPLARVAYNYAWSWHPDGDGVFREINPLRWATTGRNPVRFLTDLWPSTMRNADTDIALRKRIDALAADVDVYLAEAPRLRDGAPTPIAYLCSEFGIDASLPIYSGGLGILAGDTLKEASDQALPFVAFGLFYRRGYFHQRLDLDGKQLEYWISADPKALPMSRLTLDGEPLRLSIEVHGRPLWFQVWRVDVGRVPLFLLDAQISENDGIGRWTTARLYEGTEAVRLAQYALLGRGAVKTMKALGIDPGVIHLNEGHPALAALELAADEVAGGASFDDAIARTAERVVFTTHTPVPAGNETYGDDEITGAFADLPARLGIDRDRFLGLFRTDPTGTEPGGLTQLALRLSRSRNAVSKLHGEVAREMWRPFFGGGPDVPITHVTNGVHLPTFLSTPFRELYDRHLGEGWSQRAGDPATWEPAAEIPDAELWAARCAARSTLIDYARGKSEVDRLQRGEQIDYVRAASLALNPNVLTLGFARRLATYKRVYLLASDPDRLVRILTGTPPVQLLLAGKAHPRDDQGKEALRSLFELKRTTPALAERMVVLEDYDLTIGRQLVSGCDVWINLPRRPMEASGTSGMKTVLNGALQLSVLDGWWAEAYDGGNGWGIDGADASPEEADARDAKQFYDLLEREVVPLFHAVGDDGIPHGWCAMVKKSILTCASRFTASRMLNDYVATVYTPR
jgi:glycogen phosphorylase